MSSYYHSKCSLYFHCLATLSPVTQNELRCCFNSYLRQSFLKQLKEFILLGEHILYKYMNLCLLVGLLDFFCFWVNYFLFLLLLFSLWLLLLFLLLFLLLLSSSLLSSSSLYLLMLSVIIFLCCFNLLFLFLINCFFSLLSVNTILCHPLRYLDSRYQVRYESFKNMWCIKILCLQL